MHLARMSTFPLVGLFGMLSLAACGQKAGGSEAENVGAIGLALQVSPGNTLTSATYTITGPDSYSSAGTVAVGDSPEVPVLVRYLPNGTGYEMAVSGTAGDGVTTCEGSALFDVTNSTASTVIVHLVCGVPSGDVQVNGTINICPMLDGLSASPNAIRVGGKTALTTFAHDTDNGPAPLSYQWSANGAILSTKTPNLNFACSSAGDVILKVAVSDGDPNPACADSLSVTIECALP